jgi:hypothetical protein
VPFSPEEDYFKHISISQFRCFKSAKFGILGGHNTMLPESWEGTRQYQRMLLEPDRMHVSIQYITSAQTAKVLGCLRHLIGKKLRTSYNRVSICVSRNLRSNAASLINGNAASQQ